ncbi:unnamed protein product [Paramecium pentaurelia]|uniref:Uncharacterized protein n=1 Tax=Paramecium pentaurelia TaxID=43138 RepID=A0A8S1U686_9CILI|nr:unnamed protein product [Paramecium pentaurelia]
MIFQFLLCFHFIFRNITIIILQVVKLEWELIVQMQLILKRQNELNNEVKVTKKSESHKVSSFSQQSSNSLIDGVITLKFIERMIQSRQSALLKNQRTQGFRYSQMIKKRKNKQNKLNDKAIVIQKNWKSSQIQRKLQGSQKIIIIVKKSKSKTIIIIIKQLSYSSQQVQKEIFNSLEFGMNNANNVQSREKRPLFVFKNGATYEGEWVGNKRDGKGVQIWPDGARYDGEWVDNKACGKGSFYHVDGDSYIGEWADDIVNGYGVYRQSNGAVYEGYWRNDQQHGKREEKWSDLSSYKGDHFEGKKLGKGKYMRQSGSYFEGDWFENKINGYGEYYWSDDRIYKGSWQNNKMQMVRTYNHKKFHQGDKFQQIVTQSMDIQLEKMCIVLGLVDFQSCLTTLFCAVLRQLSSRQICERGN